jgi:hypothetical protein
MRMRRWFSLAALFALFSATVSAQTTSLGEADRAAQQRIDVLLRDFDRRGLPTELLRDKVAEGTAKGASQARIADAVALLASRVDSVARALAPAVTAPELHAGAEALGVGITTPSLQTLRAAVGRRSAEPYFLLAIRLVRRGVTQDRAVRAVRTLIDRVVPSSTLLALADDLARDVATGVSPDAALNDRMTRLIGGFGPVGPGSGTSLPGGLTNSGARP